MTPEHRKLIDRTLAAAATELSNRVPDLIPQLMPTVARLSLDELRASALGRNLAILAEVVDGEPAVSNSRVYAAIDAVQRALLVPLRPSAPIDEASGPDASPAESLERLLKDARTRIFDVSTAVFVSDV